MAVTNPILNDLSQTSQVASSWLVAHEKLIITVLVLVFAFAVSQSFKEIALKYEDGRVTQAETALSAAKTATDADLAQAKSMLAAYETALAQSTQQNTALTAAIATRNTAEATQVKTDATLPPSQLATRWQGLVNDPGVTPTASGYSVTDSAALTTVQTLELEPVIKQDLADETTKATNLQSDVDKANALISQGTITVDGLQLQLTDQTKECTTEIAAQKAAASKSKLKWFGAGFGIGFVAGATVHIW